MGKSENLQGDDFKQDDDGRLVWKVVSLKGDERVSLTDSWEKSIPDRGCKKQRKGTDQVGLGTVADLCGPEQ